MSFISGSLSFLRFKLNYDLDYKFFLKNLRAFCANDVLTSDSEESIGWASSFNFLDVEFKDENVRIGDFWSFSLRLSQKKVPVNLIRAHCQQEEIEKLKATGKEKLSRFEKSEIKDDIKEKLLKKQPIEYFAYDAFIDSRTGVMYFSGTSKKKIEFLSKLFERSFQMVPDILDPICLAENLLSKKSFKLLNQKTASWFGIGKSPVGELTLDKYLGPEFLTWLWYTIEVEKNEFEIDGKSFGLTFTDYIVLSNSIFGPHDSEKSIYQKGLPSLCSEVGTALRVGKKLYEVKFLAALEERQWEGKLDITKNIFRGIKLPNLDLDDGDDVLEERFQSIVDLTQFMDSLFCLFAEEFISDEWDDKTKKMRKWVKSKADFSDE